MANETKVTTKEVKVIAEKMAIVNSMLADIKKTLTADNYALWMDIPMAVKMELPDLIDLARVCKKKPEARRSWGDYIVSFSIYGCTFTSYAMTEEGIKEWIENGYVRMKGEKNNGKA